MEKPETVAVPYVLAEGEGEVIRWFGDTITVKASGPAFDVAIISATAGSEPPLHIHEHDDEAFYVLDGCLTIHAGNEELSAETGSFVFLPRGTAPRLLGHKSQRTTTGHRRTVRRTDEVRTYRRTFRRSRHAGAPARQRHRSGRSDPAPIGHPDHRQRPMRGGSSCNTRTPSTFLAAVAPASK
jgi:quercetin dioxygenase-like cupin family protein